MRRTGGRAQREAVGRPPLGARVAAVAALLGAFLAPPAPAATTLGPAKVETVYIARKSFGIPFGVPPEVQKKIAEVHLYVSTDGGLLWDYVGVAAPDSPSFQYMAPHDGEYWYAVRTKDLAGRLFPANDDPVVPKLKVIVDTTSPVVRLTPLPRKGSEAAIRWEVKDANLKLNSLFVEYKIQGSADNEWRQVDITRRTSGEARWNAHTAQPLLVRVSVDDMAGNTKSAERVLSDGMAEAPQVQNAGNAGGPPPIQPIPYQEPSAPGDPDAAAADPFSDLRPQPAASSGPAPEPDEQPLPRPSSPPADSPRPVQRPEPMAGADGVLRVGTPRFPVQYEVYEGDQDAVGIVEMWVKRDNDANWQLLGTDPDRQSPFIVDVYGEGRYGLFLVVQSASGLGDPRPVAGDPPHTIVEVDLSPPDVQIGVPKISMTGNGTGSIEIMWKASDPNLADRPIVLSFRPDQEGAIWQQITPPLPNTGRYTWPMPPNLPPRFFLKVDAMDTLGNQGSAETPQPVTIQVARPRGRILGLDPSARAIGGKIR